MTYKLLMFGYRAWMVITVLILLMSVSHVIFSRRKDRFSAAGKAALLALVWPLALMSNAGRQTLMRVLPKQA